MNKFKELINTLDCIQMKHAYYENKYVNLKTADEREILIKAPQILIKIKSKDFKIEIQNLSLTQIQILIPILRNLLKQKSTVKVKKTINHLIEKLKQQIV